MEASANQALERTARGRRSASAFCGYLLSLGGAGSGIQWVGSSHG